jgi:hypothetical protein
MVAVWMALLLAVGPAGGAQSLERTETEAEQLVRGAGERLFGMEGFSVRIRVESLDRGVGARLQEVRVDRGSLDRWRVDHGLPGSYWVSDGLKWLVVAGATKEYREAAEGPMVRGIRERLRDLLLRFENLPALAPGGRVIRSQTLERGGRRVPCVVVEVRSREAASPWRERLWIEPETALIWEAEFEPGVLDAGAEAQRRGRRLARYDWIKLDAPEREDVFAAQPPAGYRRVPAR